MKSLRIALWALVALALIGTGVLLVRKSAPQPPQLSGPALQVGGPFVLTDVEGRQFSSSRLAIRPYAIFFGFTQCPDVCPTTLARLVRLRQQLEAGGKSFEIVFVTVDPERDGPKELKSYVSLFNAPVIALTGTRPQIDQVKHQFGIFSEKVPDGAGGYSVDHTATVLLFDRLGNFIATIAPDEGDQAALAKLGRIAAPAKANGAS